MNTPSSGDGQTQPDAQFVKQNHSPPFSFYKNQTTPPQANTQQERVIDWRYRTSRYFLEDQLRTSEAAQDFKSVKKLLSTLVRLSLRTSYEFSPVVLELPPPDRR